MNFPNLPTDNLYKFLALTGVFLVLLCFGLLEYRLSRQVELNTEISLGKEAIGFLERDLQRFGEKLSKELEQAAKNQRELTEYSISLLIDEQKYLENQSRKARQDMLALRKISDTAENYYERTKGLSPILLSGGILGIIIAFLGFYYWYERLQKYQDMLLRYQALESARQSTKADDGDSA